MNKTNEKRKAKQVTDFTATLGEARKRKLRRIAAKENRSMAGQVCQWIDEANDPTDRGNDE